MSLKRVIILTGLFMLLSGVGVYYAVKSHRLQNNLTVLHGEQDAMSARLVYQDRLLEVDSIILVGDYQVAKQALNKVLPSTGISNSSIDFRLQWMKQSADISPLDTASLIVEVDSMDVAKIPVVEEPRQIRRQDSLRFILAKKDVQLARLRAKLERVSHGQYLQFKSSKGHQQHYVGQVKNNQANGFGVAILDTGSRYEGQWKDNTRHGEGTFYWADGQYYIGSYKNDLRNGIGTYYWPNGDKYTGNWTNDTRDGEGTFYDKEGKVIAKGIWEDDKLAVQYK